jgi:hypothetical protein
MQYLAFWGRESGVQFQSNLDFYIWTDLAQIYSVVSQVLYSIRLDRAQDPFQYYFFVYNIMAMILNQNQSCDRKLYSGRIKYSARTKYSARPNRRQYQSKKLNFRKTFFTKDKKW